MPKMHAPYVLYKKTLKDGSIWWYMRFWDSWKEDWGQSRALNVEVKGKRENRQAAENAADALLNKPETSKEIGKQTFIEFCLSCWEPGSKYAIEYEAETGIPLAAYYVAANKAGILKWVRGLKGFAELDAPVEKITKTNIANWRIEAKRQGCGPRRIEAVEQAMRVPIRWGISRAELKMPDPFIKDGATKARQARKGNAMRKREKTRDDTAGPWKTVTFSELVRILDSEYKDERILFAVACAALCGLRRGELRALEWQDIDEAARVIHVRRNIVDTEEDPKAPKWESFRDVMLPDALLPAYKRLKAKMQSIMKIKKNDYILFNTKSPGDPISLETLRYGFCKIFDQIGIPAEDRKRRGLTGLHCLRHSYASLLADANVARSEVRGMMGHSSETMTAAYTHAVQSMDAARAVFDAAIDRAREVE